MVMVLPDIRLLQAAIVLAEELHFSRAADRLHITQSALSKQIAKLEDEIGFQPFIHNHQVVEITEAGRVFVEEAREAVFHVERALQSGRAIANGATELLHLGRSAYTDPFIVSTLLSVHLPLFPGMKLKVWSNFSNDLVQQVIAGSIDVAVVTGVPDNTKLRLETIADNPFYIALSMQDDLSRLREISLKDMDDRDWILLGQHANPYLYEMIQTVASDRGIRPSDIHAFTSPDEASELIREYEGVAFLPRTAAWRIARDGITMRPLAEDRLRLVTKLAVRTNNKSRLVHEFVRAALRKLKRTRSNAQAKLPLTG
jgi:DNA-binding transcriptional LysR family regulator